MQYIGLDTAAEMEVTLTTTPQTLQDLFPNQVIPMDVDAVMIQPQDGSMRWYPAGTAPTEDRGFLTLQLNFLEKSGIGDLLTWRFTRNGSSDVQAIVAFGRSTINRS
jgi:hypothetical protein